MLTAAPVKDQPGLASRSTARPDRSLLSGTAHAQDLPIAVFGSCGLGPYTYIGGRVPWWHRRQGQDFSALAAAPRGPAYMRTGGCSDEEIGAGFCGRRVDFG